MVGCRHSFPSVEEPRICGRRGEGRCHSRGNGLDGLFGAENRGIVLKNLGVSVFVHGCVALFVSRMCIALQGAVVDLSQMRGKKYQNTDIAALVCCGTLKLCPLNGLT